MKEAADIKYPVGVQSFSELREGGYVYVDKTSYIHELRKGKYYFLSRPRRFGKSLFLSTVEAYFQGRRDLFKGLALDSLTDDWEVHPIFHLDLNNRNYRDEKSLDKELNEHLEEWEAIFGDEKKDRDPEERFAYLIKRAYTTTGKKVVILIDEYDKPLLNAINRPALADVYRETLKAFYANLKTMDPYIEMAILTGVARFSKVSIFSDLNNLRDISFDERYSAVCGITENELQSYFNPGIRQLASKMGMDQEEVIMELRRRYDGYHFSASSPDIFNPFSLLSTFARNRMGSYWFETGTPSYLVALLHRLNRPFSKFAPIEVSARFLESAGLLSSDPMAAFYQSGYLTIKSYNKDYDTYILDYPNEEVKESFLQNLLESYVPDILSGSGFTIIDFTRYIKGGHAEKFMKSLSSLIAKVPYQEKGSPEAHFQNVVYLVFTLLGFTAQMEQRTSDGRIDLTVEVPEFVYIFEFKTDTSAVRAMEQIKDKKYWLSYLASGKQIYLIGANFNSQTARLDSWEIETVIK